VISRRIRRTVRRFADSSKEPPDQEIVFPVVQRADEACCEIGTESRFVEERADQAEVFPPGFHPLVGGIKTYRKEGGR